MYMIPTSLSFQTWSHIHTCTSLLALLLHKLNSLLNKIVNISSPLLKHLSLIEFLASKVTFPAEVFLYSFLRAVTGRI